MSFERLLEKIRAGEDVESSELLPYLCLEGIEERCNVNFRLAEAYSEIDNFEQAKVFVGRSWVLSKFSPDVLPLYLKIHSALNDIESIRESYKRLGMIESSKGNVIGALRYFNLWQYAHMNYERTDKYEYDFDILARIEEMAERWRFERKSRSGISDKEKIRIAYLMFGMLHLNSVIVKISLMLAQYHDKDRFEITFFVPEEKSLIKKLSAAKKNIGMLKRCNCNVVVAPDCSDGLKRLLATGNQIHGYKPDILITSALLAEFEAYFIACLRPAPIIVGLLQGPPPQFASSSLDWAISWSKHPLIECPCDCSLVHLGLDLPDKDSICRYSKQDLKIIEDGVVLMSGGRYAKFQNIDFWKSILSIVSSFPHVYFVAVGVSKDQIPFLGELLTPELARRIRLMGWREDVLEIFCLADVVIDTFPSGGGHVLIDAMALGIPIVSFENNYMKNFDPNDWSVADEFVSIPELMVGRGNFGQLERLVSKLIVDEEYRRKMGNLCMREVYMSMGCAEKGVREFENVLLRVVDKKSKPRNGDSGRIEDIGQGENLLVRCRNFVLEIKRKFFACENLKV